MTAINRRARQRPARDLAFRALERNRAVTLALGRERHDDPLNLAETKADMYVTWKENTLCLEHPNLGRIGPVPFWRTGGHTGFYGMAYLKSDILRPGDYGIRSSFDVVPTLFDLLNERLPKQISGRSLVQGSCVSVPALAPNT